MKIKCDYCGGYISDTDEKCPNCGAVNSHFVRSALGVPKTIDELKGFCAAHNMPLVKMRFFIGMNFTEPKAFGIYKDDHGNFVVYKNKADGTRAIRYEGPDEAYAVNEIYQKIRSEIQQRKNAQLKNNGGKAPQKHRKKQSWKDIAALIIFSVVVVGLIGLIGFSIASPSPSRGYYTYNDSYYYYDTDDWYIYDYYSNAWAPAAYVDDELSYNYSDYISGSGYSDSYGINSFEDSEYYVVHDNSDEYWNDDWDDDDWDYDYDSWDYNDSDWDSDW